MEQQERQTAKHGSAQALTPLKHMKLISPIGLAIALSALANTSFAVEKAPTVLYPKAVHGTWMELGSEGRAACRVLRKDRDESKLSKALIVTGPRWINISEGERSYATPVEVRRTPAGTWHFVEQFHLYGEEQFTETHSQVRKTRPGVIRLTYEFVDSGVTKQATRSYFRCL
jgi:hypothetical protein